MMVAVVIFVLGMLIGCLMVIVWTCLYIENKNNTSEDDEEYYEWAKNEKMKG